MRVNAVVPGFVATDLTAGAPRGRGRAACAARSACPRARPRGDVAQVVAFLLSDRAAAITGQASSSTPAPRRDDGGRPPAHEEGGDAGRPPPHAPKQGRVRRLLGRFHVTGVFWYRLPYNAVRYHVLSRHTFRAWVALCSTIFSLVLWNIRNAIAANLEAVLGPCGFWERQLRIYRTIEAFSWCYGARYFQMVHPGLFHVEVDGAEHIPTDPARGVIFVTAHLGQWELSSHLASHGLKRPVHVVREEEMDPEAQEFIEGLVRG